MQVPEQLIIVAVIAICLIGVFDSFRIYFRVFKRYSKQAWGFALSHIAATMIGFLRFVPYFLTAAVILAVGNA